MKFSTLVNRKNIRLVLALLALVLMAFGLGIDLVTGKPFSIGSAQKWSLIFSASVAGWAILLTFFGKRNILPGLSLNTVYRPEIDGLRAIAVLAVLFYHAGWRGFSGGYVGVDVFFVISGYLITRLILIDLQADTFSLTRFYERRIRRIFPALFVVTLAVLAFGWFFYHAKTYLPVTKSAFAAITSWANLLFWSEAGYWDAPSAAKPLLHTWSLSVEEQFYLLYPFFLFLLAKYLKNWIREGLWIVFSASLLWSGWVLIYGGGNDAFYLPQFRLWELVTGALLLFYPIQLKGALRHMVGGFGLLAIGFAIYTFNSTTQFPGFSAMLPVFGSALLLLSGPESGTGKLLALAPFTFIGKISYSLYLWHWPILVLAQYMMITPLGWVDKGGLLLAAGILAVLSWKFVEEPVRKAKNLSRPTVFISASIGMLLIGGLFWSANATNGLPIRYQSKNIASVEEYNQGHLTYKSCFPSHRRDIGCPLGEQDSIPFFVLSGDSHSYSIAPAFDDAARLVNSAGWLVSKSSCSPLSGIQAYVLPNDDLDFCLSVTEEMLAYILEHDEITTLVLHAKWSRDFFSVPYHSSVNASILFADHPELAKDPVSQALFKLSLRTIIERMQAAGKQVVLVLPIPEPKLDVPAAYTIGKLTGRDVLPIISVDLKRHYTSNKKIINFFEDARKQYPNVTLFDPAAILCVTETCVPIVNDMPAYIDGNHLSTSGAKMLTDSLTTLLEGLK